MTSSVKRLTNEMELLEQKCVQIIPNDCCYAVKITLSGANREELLKKSEHMLYWDPQPVAIYCSEGMMLLIFSCSITESINHHLGGVQHAIISSYVRSFSLKHPNWTSVASIIVFASKIQVYTYVAWLISETMKTKMKSISGGAITEKHIQFRTENELKDILHKSHTDWDEVPLDEKYGILIKLVGKNSKTIVSLFSGKIDFRDMEHSKRIFD